MRSCKEKWESGNSSVMEIKWREQATISNAVKEGFRQWLAKRVNIFTHLFIHSFNTSIKITYCGSRIDADTEETAVNKKRKSPHLLRFYILPEGDKLNKYIHNILGRGEVGVYWSRNVFLTRSLSSELQEVEIKWNTWGKSIQGSKNSKCKDAETGACLVWSKNSKTAHVPEAA